MAGRTFNRSAVALPTPNPPTADPILERALSANGTIMPKDWRETLRHEWASTRDPAMREHLLAIYADKIAALSERERENLLAELNDLSCRTAHGSETHHMRDKRTNNEDGNE
jgi:hypothetical protein